MKGVAIVYSLNKLKLRRRFIEEQVRIERLERIAFLRVSFIRWAFWYCIYLCYIGVSSMQTFLCSSPLPHYFAYFLFPSFCPFEYPTMNSLWCDPGSRSDPYLDKFYLWSLWLHFRRYVNYECYLLCAELSLFCPLWLIFLGSFIFPSLLPLKMKSEITFAEKPWKVRANSELMPEARNWMQPDKFWDAWLRTTFFTIQLLISYFEEKFMTFTSE